tara:strand:+ start:3878 stop:4099 length:222 start_codon:yes stop_codon:yes gene_type:complete
MKAARQEILLTIKVSGSALLVGSKRRTPSTRISKKSELQIERQQPSGSSKSTVEKKVHCQSDHSQQRRIEGDK